MGEPIDTQKALEQINTPDFDEALELLKYTIDIGIDKNLGKEKVDSKSTELSDLNLELWKTKLQALFGKLEGFDLNSLTLDDVNKYITALKIVKSWDNGKGIDILKGILINNETKLKFSEFKDFLDAVNMSSAEKDENMAGAIEKISDLLKKHEISQAKDALSENVKNSFSSFNLLKDSKFKAKIDEFSKNESKEAMGQIDKAFEDMLSSKLEGWSNNTLRIMASGFSIVFMQTIVEANIGDSDGLKIFDALKNRDSKELEKLLPIMLKYVSFMGDLISIGDELKIKGASDKRESEYYEALNSPLKFMDIMKRYTEGKIQNKDALKKEITDSKKESLNYERISDDDKTQITSIGDKMSENMSVFKYQAITGVGTVVDTVFGKHESKDVLPTDEEKEKLKKKLDEFGIKDEGKREALMNAGPRLRKFIMDAPKELKGIVDFLGTILVFINMILKLMGKVKMEIENPELKDAIMALMLDKEALKNTIFDNYDMKGNVKKDIGKVLEKWKPKDMSWKDFLLKMFDKKSDFVQNQLGFDEKSGECKKLDTEKGKLKIAFKEQEIKDGTTKETKRFDLDKFSDALMMVGKTQYKPVF